MAAELRTWAYDGPRLAAESELAEHFRAPREGGPVARLQIELQAATWARSTRQELASALSARADPRAHEVGLEAAAASARVQALLVALATVTEGVAA